MNAGFHLFVFTDPQSSWTFLQGIFLFKRVFIFVNISYACLPKGVNYQLVSTLLCL